MLLLCFVLFSCISFIEFTRYFLCLFPRLGLYLYISNVIMQCSCVFKPIFCFTICYYSPLHYNKAYDVNQCQVLSFIHNFLKRDTFIREIFHM